MENRPDVQTPSRTIAGWIRRPGCGNIPGEIVERAPRRIDQTPSEGVVVRWHHRVERIRRDVPDTVDVLPIGVAGRGIIEIIVEGPPLVRRLFLTVRTGDLSKVRSRQPCAHRKCARVVDRPDVGATAGAIADRSRRARAREILGKVVESASTAVGENGAQLSVLDQFHGGRWACTGTVIVIGAARAQEESEAEQRQASIP